MLEEVDVVVDEVCASALAGMKVRPARPNVAPIKIDFFIVWND